MFFHFWLLKTTVVHVIQLIYLEYVYIMYKKCGLIKIKLKLKRSYKKKLKIKKKKKKKKKKKTKKKKKKK